MERHRQIRRSTLATALGAALAVSVFAPPLAGGDVVGDVLNTVGVGGGGAADDRAGVPPGGYKPPLHGTNPHGEGTVASADFFPSNNNPYPGSPQSGDEEVVIGDSRGEQNANGYHGRVTFAYVNLTALVPILPVFDVSRETNPGQTDTGPAGPINAALAPVCTDTTICLDVLAMNSQTTSTGSNNSFEAAGLDVLGGAVGFSALSSSGNIQESGGCQTATGNSSILTADIGPIPLDVMTASSSSTACNNGQQSTSNNSTTAQIAGAPPIEICGSSAPHSELTLFLPLLGAVCQADETNQGQTSSPYGVREVITGFVGVGANSSFLKVTLSGPESHAVAPPAAPTPAGAGPTRSGPDKGGTAGEAEGGPGAVAGEAAAGGGELAFTGQNLLILAVIGAGLLAMGLATRKRRIA